MDEKGSKILTYTISEHALTIGHQDEGFTKWIRDTYFREGPFDIYSSYCAGRRPKYGADKPTLYIKGLNDINVPEVNIEVPSDAIGITISLNMAIEKYLEQWYQ